MPNHYVEFTAEHLDSCAGLYLDVFNGEPWNDHWTFETARKRLLDMLHTPGFAGLVAWDDGPVAFAAGYREQWQERTVYFLKEMCVRADLQGKGIGTALLEHLESELSSRWGVSSVYLLTMRGDQADAFYSKNGYRANERMILMSHRL